MFARSKRQKFDHIPTANLDADDPLDDDDDDDDSSSDDDADAAQLLAELAKIKKERAAELARRVSVLSISYWEKLFHQRNRTVI